MSKLVNKQVSKHEDKERQERVRRLLDLVLLTIPAGDYSLEALFQLLRIELTTDVETACVQCAARPRLLINDEFVEENANTPEMLLTLLLHELHHIVLGHTRLPGRRTELDNLVFDIVINAMLCFTLTIWCADMWTWLKPSLSCARAERIMKLSASPV